MRVILVMFTQMIDRLMATLNVNMPKYFQWLFMNGNIFFFIQFSNSLQCVTINFLIKILPKIKLNWVI